jgi:hypothetical protein
MTFTWECGFTGTTRTLISSHASNEENRFARIHGGMHFSFWAGAGEELGKRVAQMGGSAPPRAPGTTGMNPFTLEEPS